MATETPKTETENPKEQVGRFLLEVKTFEKIGRREKGTEAETYQSRQIVEWEASNPAEILEDALSFLDNNVEHLKAAVLNGINEKRRFIDMPGADPVEQVLKFLAKKGLSVESFLEQATAKK